MDVSDQVAIVGAARTPIGAFLGELKEASAPALGACAIEGAVARAKIPVETIDEALMGCVLSAGLGQAPARQAALGADFPQTTGCVTINKMCGSGMKAIMLAHDALRAGSARAVVAGGMESMSNAPYLLDRARSGYRMGHRKIIDHMFLDGLEDAYDKGRLMGCFAEDCATALSIHPGDAGRICPRLADARATRDGGWRLRRGNYAHAHGDGESRTHRRRTRLR